MDVHSDLHLTPADFGRGTSAESFTMNHEHELADIAPSENEDSVPDNLGLHSSNVSHLLPEPFTAVLTCVYAGISESRNGY